MNYHKNSYTGSPGKKILIRVLIVVGALIVVSAATLAYGNYLKSKAAHTDVSGTGAGRSAQVSGVGRNISGENVRAKNVHSVCVPANNLPDGAKAVEYVDSLAEGGATGITVLLVDSDGVLTYASDSVAKLTHQKNSAGAKADVIAAAVSQAKKHSMQTSAVIFTQVGFDKSGVAAEIDALVAKDVAELGFDELVAILPLDAESLAGDGLNSALGYLGALSDNKGSASLGACLSYEIFSTPELSPQIENIAAAVDFLALDLTQIVGDAETCASIVSDAATNLAGSFTLYSLRAVFAGEDDNIAASQTKALTAAGFDNYMFVTALLNAIPKNEDETEKTDDQSADANEEWNAWDNTPAETPVTESVTDAPADVPAESAAPETTQPPSQDQSGNQNQPDASQNAAPDEGETPPPAAPAPEAESPVDDGGSDDVAPQANETPDAPPVENEPAQ